MACTKTDCSRRPSVAKHTQTKGGAAFAASLLWVISLLFALVHDLLLLPDYGDVSPIDDALFEELVQLVARIRAHHGGPLATRK